MKYNTYEFETSKEEVERRKKRYLRFTNIFRNYDERNKDINLDRLDSHQIFTLIRMDI